MLTRDDLVEVLAAITVTAPVRSDEVTPSTNATAVALAEAGEPEWTLVATAHQTEGKGRLGRSWSDVAGGDLEGPEQPGQGVVPRRPEAHLLAGVSGIGSFRREKRQGRVAPVVLEEFPGRRVLVAVIKLIEELAGRASSSAG